MNATQAIQNTDCFQGLSVDEDLSLNTNNPLVDGLVARLATTQSEANPQTTKKSFGDIAQYDTIRDVEDIDNTISEDVADGQLAKLDACLKLLSEDDFIFFLPSDELEDDEIHVIETVDIAAKQYSNHDLQDYQLQLMLLEQQNKRRLLMARQEQENAVKLGVLDYQRYTQPILRRPAQLGNPWAGLEGQVINMVAPGAQPIEGYIGDEGESSTSTVLDESSRLDESRKKQKRNHALEGDLIWSKQDSTFDGVDPMSKQMVEKNVSNPSLRAYINYHND